MDAKRLPKTEFAQAVAQIAGERNIDPQLILDSIDSGLISAYKRDQKEHGIEVPEEEIFSVELSPESGSFKVFQLIDGKNKDVTPPGFGRIAAQTAKQVIDQKIHEAERDVVLAEFEKKVGNLVTGTVIKADPYKLVVGIGRTEAICPSDEEIKNEILPLGVKKLFLLKQILRDDMGKSEIILSRRDNEFIAQLFAREVPEVGNNTVVIEKIARTPGQRTKVAVSSKQAGVDPVGSCIGQKGSRIQAVLSELPSEEKVDVIAYNKNVNLFIISALSPAQNIEIEDIKNGIARVTVPEDQLALAIGSGGENVHLAGVLTDLEIKINGRKETKKEE
jgi:N utilization substance protein A